MSFRPKVILRRCDRADPGAVSAIVEECFQELSIRVGKKVLIKPNVVTANRKYIHHSYTHPGVIEGIVRAVRADDAQPKITVGESSGFGVPPGLFLHEAGYTALCKRLKIRLVDFNQDASAWVKLNRAQLHEGLHLAHSIAEADTKIWAPKLKYHICCQITNALKLNMGILQHRDRMIYHDDRLDQKIVDLLEVAFPDVVVTDAVEVGHGYESAPKTVHVGLLLVSNDPLAADAVAAAILGYGPEEVVHLRMARDRGYGTIDLEEIEVTGDTTIDKARAKTVGIESEYQDIHKVDTPIRFYCGNAPKRDRFCHGGCLAAVKGCLGTVDKRKPGAVRKARPGAIVTGIYKGDVLHPNDPVLLVGDCSRVEGRLEAAKVKRLRGCPIGTMQLLFGVPRAFGLPSPAYELRSAFLFLRFFLKHGIHLVRRTLTSHRTERKPS